MNRKIVAGIDIGGTNTIFGWVDISGKILWRGNIKTEDFSSPDLLVEEIKRQLNINLLGEVVGVGVGAPSANFYSGCIEHAPNLKWEGIIPLKDYFMKAMNVPTIVTNDANAAALGEYLYGAAKGADNFMMVTLGTGLGSAFFSNGQLIYGHDGFAGELGHTIIEPEGRLCGCGRKGCLETYVSATGVEKTAFEFSGKKYSSKEVFEIANKGEKWALEVFDFTAQKLGLALANSIAITSPEAIFLFGGLARSKELLFAPTKKYMEKYLLKNYQNKISLVPSALSESDAAILGASALIWNEII